MFIFKNQKLRESFKNFDNFKKSKRVKFNLEIP